jgi:hypothetical protein
MKLVREPWGDEYVIDLVSFHSPPLAMPADDRCDKCSGRIKRSRARPACGLYCGECADVPSMTAYFHTFVDGATKEQLKAALRRAWGGLGPWTRVVVMKELMVVKGES